jgi:hypothetical protein
VFLYHHVSRGTLKEWELRRNSYTATAGGEHEPGRGYSANISTEQEPRAPRVAQNVTSNSALSLHLYFHAHRKPRLSSSLFSVPDRVLQNTRTQRIRRHGAAATAPPRLWKVDPNIVFRRLFAGFHKTLTPRTHKIHHRVLIRLSCESEAPFCSLRFTSSLWGTGELQLLAMLPVHVESVFCFRDGFDTISKGMLSTDNMGRRLGFFWCNTSHSSSPLKQIELKAQILAHASDITYRRKL